MKKHPLYDNYFITKDGKVFSNKQYKNKSRMREIKHYKNHKGYWWICLATEQGRKRRAVYHLVLETYERFAEFGEVARHIDGNNQNNCLENLAWGTTKENVVDSYRHRKGGHGQITDFDAIQILQDYVFGCKKNGTSGLAKKYGVTRQTIYNLLKGKTFSHLTRAPEHDKDV